MSVCSFFKCHGSGLECIWIELFLKVGSGYGLITPRTPKNTGPTVTHKSRALEPHRIPKTL